MKELTIKDVLAEGPVEYNPTARLALYARNTVLHEYKRGEQWFPTATKESMVALNALLARTQSILRAEWEKEQQAKYGPLVEALENAMRTALNQLHGQVLSRQVERVGATNLILAREMEVSARRMVSAENTLRAALAVLEEGEKS